MQKIEILVGIPASGKSTYCKTLMKKEPGKWKRINNDDLRNSIDNNIWTPENEKIISNLRSFMIKEFLNKGFNIIIDNLNLNKRHFEDICKIAGSLNKDIQVFEKDFYIELEEAITRDAKREGKACVGADVIKKWWKASGGKQFKFYKPRVQIFTAANSNISMEPMLQDDTLPRAVVFDNDGTISLLNGRNPYNASTCDEDLPHEHVIECMRLYFNAGYKILFVSGREEKDRAPTEKFYQKYFPEVKYKLFMRSTGDMRKDVIIKEEIFNNHIKNKYFVAGWFDDRLQVSKWVYESGLPLFRVNDPCSSF